MESRETFLRYESPFHIMNGISKRITRYSMHFFRFCASSFSINDCCFWKLERFLTLLIKWLPFFVHIQFLLILTLNDTLNTDSERERERQKIYRQSPTEHISLLRIQKSYDNFLILIWLVAVFFFPPSCCCPLLRIFLVVRYCYFDATHCSHSRSFFH